jgi:hypothetical protein
MTSQNVPGVSPGTPAVTSGPTVSSPAPGTTTSGPQDSPEAKELRRKITSQAEEIKRLRGVMEQIEQNPKVMEALRGDVRDAPKDGMEEFREVATKLWEGDERGPESFAKALATAADVGERRAIERMRQELDPWKRRQVVDTMSRKLNDFFGPSGKDLPEMAAPSSDFTRFLSTEIRTYPWLRDLLDNDLDAALSVVWERFTRENGDPAAEKQRRLERERRAAASLEDSTGMVPGMAGIVQAGGNKTLLEIFTELESRGS